MSPRTSRRAADGNLRFHAGFSSAADAATHVEKMSVMRRKNADHMVASVKTSAHVLLGLRGRLQRD
jgi:hypothetical protein